MSKSKAAKSTPAVTFDTATKTELRILCKAQGVNGYGKLNNEQMRAALRALIETDPNYQTTGPKKQAPVQEAGELDEGEALERYEQELDEQQNPEAAVDAPEAKPAAERVATVEQNGIKRPAADSLCGRVWQALDDLRAAGADTTAKNAAAAFDGVAIAAATIRTQTQRWKTFHSIKREEKKAVPKSAAPAVVSEEAQQTA